MKIAYILADWQMPVVRDAGSSIHIQEVTRALSDLGHEVFIVAGRAGDPRRFGDFPPIHEFVSTQRLLGSIYHWGGRLLANLSGRTPARAGASEASGESPDVAWSVRTVIADIVREAAERFWRRSFYRHARRLVAKERPDVLFERYARSSNAGRRLSEEFNLPLIIEMNESQGFKEEWRNRRSPLFLRWVRLAERKSGRAADKVLVVASHLRDYLLSIGVASEKIQVMPNAADPDRFRGGEEAASEIRRQYGIENKKVVGFIGSFKRWIDLDLLVACIRRLRVTHPEVHLLLVGDGELRSTLESEVVNSGLSDVVTFTGYVPYEDVPAYVRAMDIAAAPYPKLADFHFSPLKIFEYMAAARPVIASRYTDIADIVVDGVTGLQATPGDVDDWTHHLEALLSQEDISQMGERGRALLIERYTWRKNAEEILRIFSDALARRETLL